METLKRFWNKLAEERFSSRAMTILTTILTLYLVIFTPIPSSFAWVIGVLNGSMWLMELFCDDD